jgi:hypothetical protein
MGIGVGIFLITVGAILTFAVDASVAGINLQEVGRVLIVAGVVGLVLFFVFWNRRSTPEAAKMIRQRQVTHDTPSNLDSAPPPPQAAVTPLAPLAPGREKSSYPSSRPIE